jgi:hypothetical protein
MSSCEDILRKLDSRGDRSLDEEGFALGEHAFSRTERPERFMKLVARCPCQVQLKNGPVVVLQHAAQKRSAALTFSEDQLLKYRFRMAV